MSASPVFNSRLAEGRVLRLPCEARIVLAERQMIENPELAKQISDLMMDIFTRLSDSCVSVEKQCSEQEYKAYLKSTARIAGGIVLDVMEPLYDKHPHLKPPNWDEIDAVRS